MIWRSHDDLERNHPVDADQAEQEETARLKDHLRIHGNLKTYRPRREFPCPGQLVFEDRSGPIWIVACDACDWWMGLPARQFDPLPDESPDDFFVT